MTKEDRLVAILRRVIGPPPPGLTPTASLMLDLGMDELDVVELVMEIEAKLSVAKSEEEGDALKTWGNVLKLLYQKVDNHEILVPGQATSVAAAAATSGGSNGNQRSTGSTQH